MKAILIAFLVVGATPAWADNKIHLQSLVPTSGESADVLLDGDRETSWSPAGDPAGEGVLLRFETPTEVDRVHLFLCEGSGAFELVPYINGTSLAAKRKGVDGEEFDISPGPSQRKVRSLFLRIASAEGVPCLAEVEFISGAGKMAISPPRSLAGTVTATSTLSPIDAYHVGYLFDGRTDFGWVEGAKNLGEGQSVTLTLEEPQAVVALELWNGYQRSKDHFKKNARAATLALSIDGGEPQLLTIKDSMGPQMLKLKKPVTGQTFSLTIKKARRGSVYRDLVLSELRLWDESGPLSVRTPDMAERREVLERKVANTPLESVIDRQFIGLCAEMRATRLKLRGNHTFVWYEDAEEEGPDGTRSNNEVFDGAWVVGQGKPPSAVFKLYGRRHKTSSEYNPYAGNRVRDTVRIGGGDVTLTRLADADPNDVFRLLQKWAKGPTAPKVNCLDLSPQTFEQTFEALKAREAILIQGKAMTDLLVREQR